MSQSSAYAELVADFGRRYAAAASQAERDELLADFNAEHVLLRTLGPRESAKASHDTDAERMLVARFGERRH